MSELPYVPKFKARRRKRAHEGAAWSPEILKMEEAKRAGRVYCRGCGKFKPWKKLYAKYEKVKKKLIQQVWYCEDCGAGILVKEIDVRRRKKKLLEP